jgi:histidinol-phosphate/aromatic aminotransferase/cobyric acid decarboxylase-like protein
LLRRLRRHLAPNGVLILAATDPFWQVRHSPGTVTRVVGQATYRLQQAYDQGTGRLRGTVMVSAPAVAERSCRFDLRLYSAYELKSLVQQAGFRVERLDADFDVRCPAPATRRTSQLVARPLPAPPAALAVATWRTPPETGLELRYAPDETPWLDPSPAEIWRELLRSEEDLGANAAGFYAVDDPYGAERGAETVADYFGCPIPSDLLTFGAGVTALLRDLSDLAEGGLVLASELVHPDVESWTVAAGGEVHLIAEPLTPSRLMTAIDVLDPALVHLDRPTFAGELLGLADLEAVCRAASRAGAIVLIDESPASCLGPNRSAARLIHEVDNLVVVRGLTKAYSCPGLRVGFAMASGIIAPRVRELVPPLQVSELSFRAALRLLASGDVFARFRARVASVKPVVTALLETNGFEVIRGHPELPWVLVRDPQQTASERLRRLGIRGLRPAPPPTQCGEVPEFLHLSLPLSDERLAAVTACLRGEAKSPVQSPRSDECPVR